MTASLVRGTRQAACDVVVRRLTSLHPLGAEAEALVRNLNDLHGHSVGAELAGEGEGARKPRLLVSGWAAQTRWLTDGRRQIIGFVLPGDAIGLRLWPSPLAHTATIALTPVQTLDATPLLRAVLEEIAPRGLIEALRMAAGMEEALLLDQVVRLGRQTAYERLAHLLLEFHDRLADVDLCAGGAFALPLTQEVLADATGLSVVHVNRILQQLRRERLIDWRAGRAVLRDIEQLTLASDYRRARPSNWDAISTSH